jgi:glycopeptide antibiotics resistance protein
MTRFTKFVFFVYFIFLVWALFFKFSTSLATLPPLGMHHWINLEPFQYTGGKKEMLFNVLIFLPFGWLIEGNVFSAVIRGFLFSLVIEVAQYFTGLGSADVTDLITNTTGVLIGYVMFWIAYKIWGLEKVERFFRRLTLFGIIFTTVVVVFILQISL